MSELVEITTAIMYKICMSVRLVWGFFYPLVAKNNKNKTTQEWWCMNCMNERNFDCEEIIEMMELYE